MTTLEEDSLEKQLKSSPCKHGTILSLTREVRLTESDSRALVAVSGYPIGADLVSNGLLYKAFQFAEIKRGSCTIVNGEFRFYAVGYTAFVCDIMSSDSGDEWNGNFTGGDASYEGSDGLLFAANRDFHFDISTKNEWKHWSQGYNPEDNTYYGGVGSQDTYDRLKRVLFNCDC